MKLTLKHINRKIRFYIRGIKKREQQIEENKKLIDSSVFTDIEIYRHERYIKHLKDIIFEHQTFIIDLRFLKKVLMIEKKSARKEKNICQAK